MILFLTHVYKPWGFRVNTLDHSPEYKRSFVLNPHNITDLKSHAKGSTFKYFDMAGSSRERGSDIICDKTVAQIEAIMDSVPHTNAITLPIHQNNRIENSTVDTTILWSQIAFADRYNLDKENHCWVTYTKGAFRNVQVLVNLALEDVVDLIRYGSTSSTFSSVSDYFHQL